MQVNIKRTARTLRNVLISVLLGLPLVGVGAPEIPTSSGQFFFPDQGTNLDHMAFVLPLDHQKGVALTPQLHTPWAENQPARDYPWVFRTSLPIRHLYGSTGASAPQAYSVPVKNPLATFGSSVGGTPLLLGRSYRFAFFAGGQTAATDVPDEMILYVYRKSDFTGSQTGVAPVATHAIDIPHWPSVAASGSGSAWQQFGNNGYRTTVTTLVNGLSVLETTIQLVITQNTAEKWGVSYGAPLLITHKGLSSDYCFVLGYKGMISTGSNTIKPMAVSNLQTPLTSGTHVLGYGFQFDVDSPWATTLLKTPSFQGEPAPPSYYGKTADELLSLTPRFEKQYSVPGSSYGALSGAPEIQAHPRLDRLVADLGNDPLAIANYVANEIELCDALSYNENGDTDDVSVNAGGMNRNALGVYLEGQGSPEEQCALLVYLLRKAGVKAGFVRAPHNQVKMLDQPLSNMLHMRIKGAITPTNNSPVPTFVPVNYPWVAAYVTVGGTQKWVHIFPWLKDVEVVEGLAVEGFLPRNKKTIREWVRDYLLAGSTHPLMSLDAEDRTPGNLFLKDLDKSLNEQWTGMSRTDLGVRFRTRKQNRQQWTEFSQPAKFTEEAQLPAGTSYQLTPNLTADPSWYDTLDLEIASTAKPTKKISLPGLRLMDLHNRRIVVNFKPVTGSTTAYDLQLSMEAFDLDNPGGTGDFTTGSDPYLRRRQLKTLRVNTGDAQFSFKTTYHRLRAYAPPPANDVVNPAILGGWSNFLGINHIEHGKGTGEPTDPTSYNRTLVSTSYFGLGDLSAFCLNTGRVTQKMMQPHLDKFWEHEQARLATPPAAPDYELMKGTMVWLMGMSYYQRVSTSAEQLRNLFKVHVVSERAHGFALLGALRDAQNNLVIANGQIEQVYPKVDMNFFRSTWAAYGDVRPDVGGQSAVSGNDFMSDMYVAELSALESHTIAKYLSEMDTDAVSTVALIQKLQQDNSTSTNVVELNSENWLAQKSKNYTFEGQTRSLEEWAGGQTAGSMWKEVEALFTAWDKDLGRVYITPGPVTGAKGQWKGMGALIIGRDSSAALIGRLNGAYSAWSPSFTTSSSTYSTFFNSTAPFNGGITAQTFSLGSTGNISLSSPYNYSDYSTSSATSFVSAPIQVGSTGTFLTTFGSQNTGAVLNSYSATSQNSLYASASAYSGGSISYSTFSTSSYNNTYSNSVNAGYLFQSSSYTSVGGSLYSGDPVNTMTGELYADEVDLVLPGPLPIQVRRNYSSQSLAQGNFGYGWKMAYFPYLFVTENEGKVYAAELDGSVIVYSRTTSSSSEWVVKPENNPGLTNGDAANIGSVFNRYLNKLTRSVVDGKTIYRLTGGDGTLREYVVRSYPLFGSTLQRTRPYIKRWEDANGNFLDFVFHGDVAGDSTRDPAYGELAKVKASNGNYLGFSYDAFARIVEAYAHDGRRLYYSYDDEGDLREVRLPDNSWAKYEYLHEQGKVGTGASAPLAWSSTHLLNREIRPEGRVVESDYQLYVAGDTDVSGAVISADKVGKPSHLRRVVQQRATVGKHRTGDGRDKPAQESYLPVRNSSYTYNQSKDAQGRITGSTQVKDAYNRTTTLHYVNSQLTLTVDSLGMETSQEWFTKNDVTAGVAGAYENALKAIVDKRGLRTEFKYNASGDLTEITAIGDLDGDGTAAAAEKAVTSIASYNARHLPEVVIRPNPDTGLATGGRTRYTYGDAARPYMVTLVEELAADGTTVITSSSMTYHDVFTVAGDLTKPFSKGLLRSTRRAAGTSDEALVEWEHDPRGFPSLKTSATGTADPTVKTAFTYNLRGELLEERAMDGTAVKKTNRYAYDDVGRRIWEERLDATGKQVGWNYVYYNLNGDVEWTDGSRHNPEDYSYTRYDGGGRPVEKVRWRSEAKPDGTGVQAVAGVAKYATSFFGYNLFGDLIKTVDPLGNTTKATYDNLGRVLTQTAYQGDWEAGGTALATESFAYGQSGNRETYSRHTDVRGGVTEIEYTSHGKPRSQSNPDGSVQAWRYYADGRLRREPANGGKYWEYTYNDINRKTTQTLKDALGAVKGTLETVTDRRGNVVSIKNLAGYTVTKTYDKLDRVKTETAPADATAPARSPQLVTTYTYDAAGFEAKVSNALNESTVTTLDSLGRVIGEVVKNAQSQVVREKTVSYTPDFHGVTTTEGTSGQGVVVSRVWTNVDGDPVLLRHADGTYVTTTYDLAGQAVSVKNEIGNVTQTAYDALGRTSRVRLPDNAETTFSYAFTSTGEQQERHMPGQLVEVVKYNKAGQLTEKYNQSGAATTRHFQNYIYYTSGAKAGFLHKFTDPLGQVHEYGYDESWGRVTSYTSGTVGNVARVARSFSYDSAGRMDGVTETTGAGTASVVQQVYAQNGALLTEKLTLNGTIVRHVENSYDAAGRRVRLARGTDVAAQGGGTGSQQDYTWRADGLLGSVTASGVTGTFNYTYGTQGALLSRINPFRTQTINPTTGRDARGRLISMQTTVTGVAGTLLGESVTWADDSRQLNYSAARGAAGGVAAWTDARAYLYVPGRRQLNTETYGMGPQGGSQTLYHTYDFGQSAGLGVRTNSLAATEVNGVKWGSWVGDGAAGGMDAFGRVTDEYAGSERFHVRAHGHARGAKEVTLQLNGEAHLGTSDTSLLPSDPLSNWSSGNWEKWLSLEAGAYTLKAEATHPSGQKASSADVNFTVRGGAQPVINHFDANGQVWKRVISGGYTQQLLTWDAEGRLIKVVQTNPTGAGWQWEAVYDGFNRRVRTISTPLIARPTGIVELDLTKKSREDVWYDPLVEFLEVAVEINGERQWAVHGPDLSGNYGGMEGMGGLEAWVVERTGQSTGMVDDMYGHVVGSVSGGTFSWQSTRSVGYGPQSRAPVYRIAEGASLAQATNWRGKRQDITGFYHMGARYYDPQGTRFLSTDPMGHAASMSLYDYANGDPINFVDPRGRNASQPAYGKITSSDYLNFASSSTYGQDFGTGFNKFVTGFGEGISNAFTPANIATTIVLTAATILAPQVMVPLMIGAAVVSTTVAVAEWSRNDFAFNPEVAGNIVGNMVGSALIGGVAGLGTNMAVGLTRSAGASLVRTGPSIASAGNRGFVNLGGQGGSTQFLQNQGSPQVIGSGLVGNSNALAATYKPTLSLTPSSTPLTQAGSSGIRNSTAGNAVRPASSPHYSVLQRVELRPGTFRASDGNHFRQGNRQLYEMMQADPTLAAQIEAQFPGTIRHVTPGPRGGFADTSPPGLTWHHHPEKPGVLELVPRPQHQAPGPVQGSLHPGGTGGRENWGGGRRRP